MSTATARAAGSTSCHVDFQVTHVYSPEDMSVGAEPTGLEPAPQRRSLLAGALGPVKLGSIFGIAALARLLAVVSIPWQPSFDDAWYFRTARELAAGRGYLDDDGKATAYFPAGYSLTLGALLRVLGSSFVAAQLVNVAFSMATMYCVYRIALRVGAEQKLAGVAAAFFGFLPNQIVSCCVTMSEITFTFALTLAVLLALQPIWERKLAWALLVGAVFGWATLIRPQAVLLPVLLVPLISYLGRREHGGWAQMSARVALVMLGLIATVGPWTYRNYRVFDTFVLVSTNGGENLLIGNNPKAVGRYSAPVDVFPREVDVWKLPELERDRLGRRLAHDYLRANPVQALLRLPKKLWYMYRSDLGVTNWIWDLHGPRRTLAYYLAQGLTQLGYLVVLGFGFSWLALGLSRPPQEVGPRLLLGVVACIVIYFSAITLVFFGDSRFHQPLMPFLVLAAAHGFAKLRWTSRSASVA
jgi:hypothetical protein